MYQPPTTGAACAIHPDQPAQAICSRCGNFMCTTCTENGSYDACPKCREITGDLPGFTWTRENYSLDGLLSFAWGHFRREWLMLSLAALILAVVNGAAIGVSQVFQLIGAAIHPFVAAGFSLIGSLVQAVVSAALTGGFMLLLYDVMKGRQADLGRMFGQFANLGTYLVITLIGFAIGIGLMLVVGIGAGVGWGLGRETGLGIGMLVAGVLIMVPALWLSLPFMFTELEVALGGETRALQAVTNVFRIADGHRLWMFLFSILIALMWFGGLLACCFGIFPALALANALKAGLYLALRNGSGLPPLRGQL